MRLNSAKSACEKIFWARESLRSDRLRARGGPPVVGSYLPAPVSAQLSASGVLSWTWVLPAGRRDYNRVRTQQPRKVIANLCEAFAALADAPDEKIRRFAAHWGPLRYPRSRDEPKDTETVDQWRQFAALARAVVRCATALSEGSSGLAEDWRAIALWLEALNEPKPTIHHGLLLVASALNKWYARSSANALVTVHRDKIVIQPSSELLFGIIGMQLARHVTGAQDALVCYHCGRFYVPKNRPRTGARNFCPTCRRARKPEMYAMRDHRARGKGQK